MRADIPKRRKDHFDYVASQYKSPELWEAHLNEILRQYV